MDPRVLIVDQSLMPNLLGALEGGWGEAAARRERRTVNMMEMFERESLKEVCAELSLFSADLGAHIEICSSAPSVPMFHCWVKQSP